MSTRDKQSKLEASFVAEYNRLRDQRQQVFSEFMGPFQQSKGEALRMVTMSMPEPSLNPPIDSVIQSNVMARLFDNLQRHPDFLAQVPTEYATAFLHQRIDGLKTESKEGL